ncbi:MAG: hypothetical protein GX117_13915 [Candidatus Hydrogenedentes bacterium]|nr:hypothetical protein [Candidatus Hydrogenedentota bacterium]
MGTITLICGGYQSDRSKDIDIYWENHWGRALLLTPTRRLARQRLEQFIRSHRLPGIWGAGSFELTAFAASLLENQYIPIRMVSRLERRLIVRTILEEMARDRELPSFGQSPGLIKHLLRLITQLKQAAIDPDQFEKTITAHDQQNPMDIFTATVYKAYQKILHQKAYYDVPGLYWAAREYCDQETITLPNNTEILLLDGFDDFTPSQERFLECLSKHVSKMVIGINMDPDPDQEGLFHLQKTWVDNFQKKVKAKRIDYLTDPPKNTIQHAAYTLFRGSECTIPLEEETNLQLQACADGQHEIEWIGRKIKTMILNESVSPSSIAVALTDMQESHYMIRATFEEFGIPCRFPAPRLSDTLAGVMVTRIIQLFSKWKRETLLAVLSTSLWDNFEEYHGACMTFPTIIRACKVRIGRRGWERTVALLTQPMDPEAALKRRMPLPLMRNPQALALFQQRFQKLTDFEDSIPDQGSLGAYARLWEAFLNDSGMIRSCEGHQQHGPSMAGLRALLQEFSNDSTTKAPMDWTKFSELLRDSMAEVVVHTDPPQGESVYCCTIDRLRCESFPHIFLGGLNEGLMPRPAPRNALYSEIDLSRLRKNNLMLSGRGEHTYRERLIFYHALSAAQTKLFLTWRKQDKSGRDSLPSPFIVELTNRLDKKSPVLRPDPLPDCFVPIPEEIASFHDLANVAYLHRIKTKPQSVSTRLFDIDACAAIEEERQSKKSISKYDGIILAPDLLEHLADQYSKDHLFSVSSLERYLRFPFDFFINNVLGIRSLKEPDNELGPMLSGTLLHEILRRFHEHYTGLAVHKIFEKGEEAAFDTLKTIIEEVFQDHRSEMVILPKAIIDIEQQRLLYLLKRFLKQDFFEDDGFSPSYFECSFGEVYKKEIQPPSVPDPFVLNLYGQEYRFSGIIDRIDRCENRIRLIDYKLSATPAAKEIKDGLSLQLTLYTNAAKELLFPDCEVDSAYYLSVLKGDKRDALLKKAEDSDARRLKAASQIVSAVASIRSGYFPPAPTDTSGRIPPHTAARYEEWRIAPKEQRALIHSFDPALGKGEDQVKKN